MLVKERAKNLVLGALVADAATMGTHWIYDQDHIAKLAPSTPEFRAPNAADYQGVPGYFAHEGRKVGDLSQYGEQALVLLRSVAANDGAYDAPHYAAAFRSHFGYGGAFTGYIDHATRETLNNFLRAEDAALAQVKGIAFHGNPKVTVAMIAKALALTRQFSGPVLRTEFEQAVRLTHDDDATVDYGFRVLDEILAMTPVFGAWDVQLPAISKLPGLALCFAQDNGDGVLQDAWSAVRTTNDHPTAQAHGRMVARMMQRAVHGDTVRQLVDAGRAEASPEVDTLLADALGRMDEDANSVTRHFGLACDLDYGVPAAVHNVMTAGSFTAAVRRNIYAGGDNCGRSILVGALCGAVYGVGGDKGIPHAWLEKLTCCDDVEELRVDA
ncbi:hypothetical protein ASD8599_00868 [Ascidiaceihabitans donghaensis]|uniref:ADP-ribosylglycohydrolase n=1 Tax=Ascidiaceihabitans donghaensis TaxID=1510460 RepID=A0A2R8BAR4_9RHOB|nr:ADP-ribosylglycohydrolase family protein [Ascidiaceihabitans donghaensis]SPH20130.1 hypothetical protein ASD8599_00868 [Ascidiaceihabitans donghaensis]